MRVFSLILVRPAKRPDHSEKKTGELVVAGMRGPRTSEIGQQQQHIRPTMESIS